MAGQNKEPGLYGWSPEPGDQAYLEDPVDTSIADDLGSSEMGPTKKRTAGWRLGRRPRTVEPQTDVSGPYQDMDLDGYDHEESDTRRGSSRTPVAVIAILAVVGVLIYLVVNGGFFNTAQAPEEVPVPSIGPVDPVDPPAGEEALVNPGWTLVENPNARLAYEIPPEWEVEQFGVVNNSLGVPFSGLGVYETFQCDRKAYYTGMVGSAATQTKDGSELDPSVASTAFALAFARDLFPSATRLQAVPTAAITTGSLTGAVSEVLVTSETAGDCVPASARVMVAAWPVPGGATMMVMVDSRTSSEAGASVNLDELLATATVLPPNS